MDEYKTWIAGVFDRCAPEYGSKGASFFQEFGKQLVRACAPKPGDQVLDVATGRGAVLFEVLRAVGSSGAAVGIDLSSNMIALLQKELQKGLYAWGSAICCDAEAYEAPAESFNLIVSGFGLFFLPNLQKTLQRYRDMLVQNGRIGATFWLRKDALGELFNRKLAERKIQAWVPVISVSSTEAIVELFQHAGYSEVSTQACQVAQHYLTPEDWFDSYWQHASRGVFERMSPQHYAELREEVLAEARGFWRSDGLNLQLDACIVLATK